MQSYVNRVEHCESIGIDQRQVFASVARKRYVVAALTAGCGPQPVANANRLRQL
jgi:hypothetical protein